MAVDFKTFVAVAPHVARVKKPILLRGRHGVGKSCVVYQTAANLGLPVVERRASQMTEGDLVGLPKTDGNALFSEAGVTLLFLGGTVLRLPGYLRVTAGLNGHVLHPDTLIFAAVNGGEHGEQYQVGEMDPAELDRWTVFDVEPTVEDWLNWAKPNVNEIIWDFINQNRDHLEHTGDFEPNKVYPSRRSWDRFNECVEAAGFLTDENRKEAAGTIYELGCAFIGFEAAVAFRDFAEKYERQVTVEMILVNGELEKIAEFGINDHCALVDKMESTKAFEAALPEEQIANLAAYFLTLPSEVAMKLWTVLGDGHIDNTVALHQSVVDGVPVAGHIVELLTGEGA